MSARSTRLALAVLLALLAPGVAQGYTTLAPSNPKWAGNAMTFRIHAGSFTTAGLGTAGAEASYEAWEADPLSALVVTRGADVTTEPSVDSRNDVYYSTVSIGSGTLAVTSILFNSMNVVEVDITVNGADFLWSDPLPGGCSGRFDLRSTLTHEAGHALGLDHSSEDPATCQPGPAFDPVYCDATMYYSGGPCDATGQSLECDDLAGIRFLYPPSGTPRADWAVSALGASPAGGTVAPGQLISITGTARNEGSLTTAAGTVAVHVASSAGSFPGAVDSDPLAATASCRTAAVALACTFTVGDAGTRFLNVRLDDSETNAEYSESNNVISFGPYTVMAAGPVVTATPASLEFAAAVGQSAPGGQSVTVGNAGGGTFTWSVSSSAAWLTAAPLSGSPGGAFTATVNHSGLAAGMYSATLTVTAPGATGSPLSVPVQLTVAAGPVLAVAPASFSFAATAGGALPASQPLSITNAGIGSLAYTATDNATWLSVAPGTGSAPAMPTVSVTTTAMAAGTYNATITVDGGGAQGSPVLVPVSLVLSVASPAVLAVAPASLTFSGPLGGPAPATQSLSVTNTGSGALTFTASDDRPWLSISPSGGSAPSQVVVSVDPTGLNAGTHAGTLTVSASGASGSPASIPVTYTVSALPSLALAPASFSFVAVAGGANPPAQQLTVANDGAGSLSYTVTDDVAWLALAPGGGGLPSGGTQAHSVTVAVAGLPVGTHVGSIMVTAPGADDSPQSVPVTLQVTAQPPLQVTPAQLMFAATPAAPTPPSQAVTVTTGGAPSVTWTASPGVPWLSLTPVAGAGDGAFQVTASAAGLGPGLHSGSITVSAAGLAGSPRIADVQFDVAPGPQLLVLPTSASWSVDQGAALPTPLGYSVSNIGTGALAFTVVGAPSWLQVLPPSGTAPGAFTLGPNTTGLPVGRYTANVTVSASGAYDSPQVVAVSYTILGPSLVFTPERLRIEIVDGVVVSSPAGTVVSGAAPGAVAFSVVSARPWLAVSAGAGSTGDTLFASVLDPAVLPVGVHDGALVFMSAVVRNSPAPVPVSVIVRESDAPSAWPGRIDLHATVDGTQVDAARLALDEAGDGDGDWDVVELPSWLGADPASGPAGSFTSLSIDAAGLAAGGHDGLIAVETSRGRVEVPAHLDVHALPALAVDSESVDLLATAGSTSAATIVSVRPIGPAPFTFTAAAGATWMRVSPPSGAAPSMLLVSADAAGLAPGQFTGTLSVQPAAGGAPATVAVRLRVVASGVPLADFDASPGAGCGPLMVAFTDVSSGPITSRSWDFGDGTSSTLAAPSHAFAAPGTHAVTLTVVGGSGSSSTQSDVVVRQPPLVQAGSDRRIHFEPDGETLVRLDGARIVAAAPARLVQRRWTTNTGTFEDTGTAVSGLERPTLVVPSSRGGLTVVVDVEATDDFGCSGSDQARLVFPLDADGEADGHVDILDNCPGFSNFSQGDFDRDGFGDGCDKCPSVFNPLQLDLDGNFLGDDCDPSFSWSVSLSGEHARPCAGTGGIVVTASGPAAVRARRLALFEGTGRGIAGGEALGSALGAGGVVAASSVTADGRGELRVAAGFIAAGPVARVQVPVLAGDGVLDVACEGALFGLPVGVVPGTCGDAVLVVQPNADIAPTGAPNGSVDVGDVVRILRASVGLEALTEDEAARADLAPGSLAGNLWQASPDCSINIADVIVALRVAVGLTTLP